MPKISKLLCVVLILNFSGGYGHIYASSDVTNELSLEKAIGLAQKNDPWLEGNQHRQDAIEAMSVAVGSLPDPKVSVGLANIATDTFDFNQERMTQLKFGVSQMFPRGDSLEIQKQQLQLLGSQYPFQREDRRAQLTVKTAILWLTAYKAQESIALIEADRALFEQLADVAEASYSSALGKTRQQDIVRAQLELTRLDDRLTMLRQILEMSQYSLVQWLSEFTGDVASKQSTSKMRLGDNLSFTKKLPDIYMRNELLYLSKKNIDETTLYQYFYEHPSVKSLDQKIAASKRGIDLAKQKYKPEWGVNAGYGYRGEDNNGNTRADLFSVGISFDLPLFTAKRQDKQLQSAVSSASAIETEKWLLVRKLISTFKKKRAELQRLNERASLYQTRLLPQIHDQAEASLTAYTNDDGDFAEVVRARIAELNARIDSLNIDVDRQKSIVELNYLFITHAKEIVNQQAHEQSSPIQGKTK